MSAPKPKAIATLNEGPLHAGLKDWYAQDGDRMEVPVDGRQIDIVRGELLIEIQTGSFAALKQKLAGLLRSHRVRLVHPIPKEKWIVRVDDDETLLGRRKSPNRGRVEDMFAELVSLPALLADPNFSVEILLTQEEEVRRHEPGRARRRKGWMIVERRLLDVVERHLFEQPRDLQRLLGKNLPRAFTTADLATSLGLGRDTAQKMAYVLRKAGAIHTDGKKGNAQIYRVPA